MGIKYTKDYEQIIDQLSEAISRVHHFYEVIDMTEADWRTLEEAEQKECIRTIADDLFYALGSDPQIEIGSGSIEYKQSSHRLVVSSEGRHVSDVLLS